MPCVVRGVSRCLLLAAFVANVEALEHEQGAPHCDDVSQGCEIDERRDDEPHSLQLLQVQVQLQSDSAPAAPVAPRPVAQREKAARGAVEAASAASGFAAPRDKKTSGVVEVEVGKAADSLAVGDSKQAGGREAHDSDLAFRSPLSQLSLLQLDAPAVQSTSASTRTRAAVIGILLALVLVIGLLVVLATYMKKMAQKEAAEGLGAKPQVLTPGPAVPLPSPAGQQLLQAPRAAASPQPAQTGINPHQLPPICPSLILPHTEARFMIPIESLMRASGELDIRGTSGRKLLHGSVSETAEGQRCLSFASCGCEEDPRVTVLSGSRERAQGPISGGVSGMSPMQVYGKSGKFYGTLEPAEDGGAILRHMEQTVMSLEIGNDLRMTASSMDGRLLATAGKNVQVSAGSRMESHDTWKLQVKPGFDAVLIVACMLGAMLFSEG